MLGHPCLLKPQPITSILFPPSPSRFTRIPHLNLSLDSVLPLREVPSSLLGLLSGPLGILLAQSSSDSTSLLDAEVERHVLLLLVVLTEGDTLVSVDDGEDAGDRFTEVVSIESQVSVRIVPMEMVAWGRHCGKRMEGEKGSGVMCVHSVQLGL